MDHLDEELLGLLALGESAGQAEALHLEGCRECGTTLEALRRTVFAATVNPEEVQLENPGSQNWAAIHQALRLSPSLAKDPLGAGGAGTLQAPGRRYPGHQPVARPPRRGLWVLGAAAGVLLGAAGAWTELSILGPAKSPEAAPASPAPTAAVVAEAALTPLAGHSASGNALVERLPHGSRQVVVSLPEEKLSGFREVWLGSADLSKMVSLGVLGQAPQAFVVPAGLDLADYPVLDVSNEPYDGDPAHSAESIARGKLALQG